MTRQEIEPNRRCRFASAATLGNRVGWSRVTEVRGAWIAILLVLGMGCATPSAPPLGNRPFEFGRDTLAFANELAWEYAFESNGAWHGTPKNPQPDYTLRCFVLTRTVKQFYLHARFDPRLPRLDESGYRRHVRQVIRASPRRGRSEDGKIVIPGFADLASFSREHEQLLKGECGGAWQSYFQRGHWRMIFPFTRRHQELTARRLLATARVGFPAVLHLVDFPGLGINHSVVVFSHESSGSKVYFGAYDPDSPGRPLWLMFDWSTRAFRYPSTRYFPGGRINAYEVFWGGLY